MAYYSKDQIAQAKSIDLYSYLEKTNPDELVHESRNTFHTRTHDSLKISNGMWFWFSRGIGGKSALEYLIKVQDFTFLEAIEHLLGQKGIEKSIMIKRELTEKEKIERLKLPTKANNNQKVIRYLMSRGIEKSIIEECIDKNYIYQDIANNVVFVGYDESNNARYGMIRGTNLTRYMHDAYGSDKAYSFKLVSQNPCSELHIFESAIDLLSYATLLEMNNERWYDKNLLSLAGVYNVGNDITNSKIPKTISLFLNNNPNINTIILHLDNDIAGRKSTKAIQISLSDSYKIIDDPPTEGKDFNDFLCLAKGIYSRKNEFIER